MARIVELHSPIVEKSYFIMTQKTADYIRLDNEKSEIIAFERCETSKKLWDFLSQFLVGSAFKITKD